MAYANLFVGMARAVGLDAIFVDVVTVHDSYREGDLIVSSGHITAGVLQSDRLILVDFTDTPERRYRGHKPIDDLTAIAQFYNNEAYLRGLREEGAGDAIELYRLVLAIDPSFYPAHSNLGVALKRRGRLDEAIKEYELALKAKPDFAEARANMGAALAARGRPTDAIRQFELAIRADPASAQLRHQKGMLLLQEGRFREAERAFRDALRRDAHFAPSAYYLGDALLAQGKKKDAMDAFRRALQIDPEESAARRRLEELERAP
jgi:Tfp pilus assembly protein PilF